MNEYEPTPEEIAMHDEIVAKIRAALVGNPPQLQGSALADCLGSWLAGHHFPPEIEQQGRTALLQMHVAKAIQFMGAYDAIYHKRSN